MSTLAMDTNLDTNQRDILNTILKEAESLLEIINDILDFSKIESGKIKMNHVVVNIHYLFESIYEVFLPVAQGKNIHYTLKIDSDIHTLLKTDEQHIRQILQNFINNALKFTPEYGSVSVYVELISTQNDTQRIKISVKDTGIGILESNLKSIVQPFSQADSSTTRKFGGTGLGLSISKSLIELLGGEMDIVSREGRGSIFSFEIDTTIPNPSQQYRYEEEGMDVEPSSISLEYPLDFKNEKTLNILIVEDYEVNQMFIGMLLNNYHKIIYDFANNGKEAIKMLKKNTYDIILMDINMPVMNGCDATIVIREELKLDIPIIALTANALEGDEEKFLNIGMDGYLAKPLEIRKIDTLLKKYRPC
jgi:CheY-like chemotaxis protein/two-component sensor histidine kinase